MPYVGRGVVMLIKINGGTLINGDKSLCETCVHSRITKGRRLEKELVLCEAGSMQSIRITFKVTSCTQYMDASYHELLERAWILKPGSTRRPAGFVRASELRYDECGLPPEMRPKKF